MSRQLTNNITHYPYPLPQQEINKHPEKDPKRVPKTIIFRGRKVDCDSLADQLYGLVRTQP